MILENIQDLFWIIKLWNIQLKRHQKQCSLKEKQIHKCTDGGKDDQCS